ncbi:MAG: thioredoxin [Deltaproteobacteria bacterium]|nr:thioredoxin [Deltaproteobacteria bacterium]MBI3390540.1 thioredoxin [Deltaproteobacteria bacterium]
MAEVRAVTDDAFDAEVLDSTQPVLIDFWAPHCSACRTLAPIVETLAQEYAGKLKVMTVNTEENPRIATRYAVRAIPNLLFFKDGRVHEQVIGAVPKLRLVRVIDQLLS